MHCFLLGQQSNVLSVALDGLDEISQRQVVVHLEMLPSGVGADDVDILCGDVRVLDHLQVVLQVRSKQLKFVIEIISIV